MTTDYERGDRSRAAVAVQIDRTLDRLLPAGADREELWPLLYEYARASEADDCDDCDDALDVGEQALDALKKSVATTENAIRVILQRDERIERMRELLRTIRKLHEDDLVRLPGTVLARIDAALTGKLHGDE